MRPFLVSALLATATGQLTCQNGHGLFHTTTLVHTGADDIEENHASYNSTGARVDACEDVGYVFEGSADLELGNDVQHLGKCGQYVGIRFQNLNVPAGATIMQATIKFTVDESTQPVIKDGRTDDGAKSTTYWGNWTAPLEAHIRARKVTDAPVWLDPASVDPDVVANRDCPTASQCFSNYDCPAMSRWDWIPEMSDCSYFEDGRFAAYMIQLGWEAYLSKDANGNATLHCDCSSCKCGRNNYASPAILHQAMMNEATDELVLWAPSGENITEEELTSGRPTQLTPDLKSLVQEVIDLEGWRAGNAIAFLIDGMPQYDGTGALRTYESYEGANSDGHAWTTNEPEFGPTLEVTYCAPVTCPAGGQHSSLTLRVSNGQDDVQERQGADRTLRVDSTDLTLGGDAAGGGPQLLGIRFQDVEVPPGAIITGASLMLTVDESYNADGARYADWIRTTIRMRRVGHAPAWLGGTSGSGGSSAVLSSIWNEEATNTTAAWAPGGASRPECAGAEGCPTSSGRVVQFTTDFGPVLQEVISLPTWRTGNAVAVMIDVDAEYDAKPAVRKYESFEGTSTEDSSWTDVQPMFRPTLFVSFCSGGAGPAPPPLLANSGLDDGERLAAIIGSVALAIILFLFGVVFCFVKREREGNPIFTNIGKAGPVIQPSPVDVSVTATKHTEMTSSAP